MYTLIDLAALKAAAPLVAAQELTSLNVPELWSVVAMLKLKAKKHSSKEELINLVLAATHPAAPAIQFGRPAVQLGLL